MINDSRNIEIREQSESGRLQKSMVYLQENVVQSQRFAADKVLVSKSIHYLNECECLLS